MTLALPMLWEISRGRRRFRPCSRRIRRRLSESNYFGKCSTFHVIKINASIKKMFFSTLNLFTMVNPPVVRSDRHDVLWSLVAVPAMTGKYTHQTFKFSSFSYVTKRQ
jgi:hypothetical protein